MLYGDRSAEIDQLTSEITSITLFEDCHTRIQPSGAGHAEIRKGLPRSVLRLSVLFFLLSPQRPRRRARRGTGSNKAVRERGTDHQVERRGRKQVRLRRWQSAQAEWYLPPVYLGNDRRSALGQNEDGALGQPGSSALEAACYAGRIKWRFHREGSAGSTVVSVAGLRPRRKSLEPVLCRLPGGPGYFAAVVDQPRRKNLARSLEHFGCGRNRRPIHGCWNHSPAGSRLRPMGGLAGNRFVLSVQSWRAVVCALRQRSYREDSHIFVASRIGEGTRTSPGPGYAARSGIR